MDEAALLLRKIAQVLETRSNSWSDSFGAVASVAR